MAETKKPTAPAAPAATKAPKEEAPTKVTIVPNDGMTDAEKASAAESNSPAAVDNRNKSYLPPDHDGIINQADPEKK